MWIYRYRHRSNPYELEKSTTVPSVALPTFPGSFVPKEKSHQLVESTGLELIDPEARDLGCLFRDLEIDQ